MENIYLVGADDVRSAGSAMRTAAGEMQSAASAFDNAVQDHKRFMDDWLNRFQSILEEDRKAGEAVMSVVTEVGDLTGQLTKDIRVRKCVLSAASARCEGDALPNSNYCGVHQPHSEKGKRA